MLHLFQVFFYLRQEFLTLTYLGKVGRRTSFEVTVNDAVIHSKLSTMNFPDIEETVSIVQGVEGGAEPKQVS